MKSDSDLPKSTEVFRMHDACVYFNYLLGVKNIFSLDIGNLCYTFVQEYLGILNVIFRISRLFQNNPGQ